MTNPEVLKDDQSNHETVRQTIVASIEAPRLTDINVVDFVRFNERRAVYERQVEEKNQDSAIKITPTSYKNSLDEHVLSLFIMANWIEAETVDAITDDQIKDCIEKMAHIDEDDYDLGSIGRDIVGINMEKPRKGANLEKQVWRLCLKYITTLKRCGYDKFVDKNPKLAIKHIFKRVSDRQLKSRMHMLLDLHKDQFKNDFRRFVRQLAKEARAIDLQESARRYREIAEKDDCDSDDDLTGGKRNGKSKFDGRRGDSKAKTGKSEDAGNANKHGSRSSGSTSKQKQDRKRRLPKCLNTACDGEHFIIDCPITSGDDQKRLKEAYREAKRQKQRKNPAGKIGQISGKKY